MRKQDEPLRADSRHTLSALTARAVRQPCRFLAAAGGEEMATYPKESLIVEAN